MEVLKDRLAAAMRSIKVDPKSNDQVRKLAAKIGITYQGLRKLIDGHSAEMKAGTNAKAAKVMGVDSDWLATGEGEMHSERVWPFTDLSPSDWNRVAPNVRAAAEKGLLSAVPAPPTPVIVKATAAGDDDDRPLASSKTGDAEVVAARLKAKHARNKNR